MGPTSFLRQLKWQKLFLLTAAAYFSQAVILDGFACVMGMA